ncbi:CreA family protein [Amphritea sp.]|uniref:CreA family protein n=1 Tax=Amphritea sp. TaxID=1872502 RepID=UPI003A900880
MKRLLTMVSVLWLAGCGGDEVGDVSLGILTTKDIKLNVLVDPVVTGVTCHIASIEADLDFADPSDSSIACRQTGPITAQMIAAIDRSKDGEVVFRKSKSVLFKTMKVRRIFDPQSQTLMYLSYSTKEINGSYKHSLSTVPLWGTSAYQ